MGVGRRARTGVDTDSGMEPAGRIAARRSAVTPGDLETVTTSGPHTTAVKNVAVRGHDARSIRSGTRDKARLRPVRLDLSFLRHSVDLRVCCPTGSAPQARRRARSSRRRAGYFLRVPFTVPFTRSPFE